MRVTSVARFAAVLALAVSSAAFAKTTIGDYVDKPDEWFASDEGRKVLANVLTWQNANGGWWKQYDASVPRTKEAETVGQTDWTKAAPGDGADTWHRTSTIDNKATFSELRVLARAVRVTNRPEYKAAFDRGLAFLFKAQHPNGGWPQRWPLENNYGRYITYNDDAMVGVLRLLRDAAAGKGDFAWLPPEQREAAKASFDRGIECVLNTQIKIDGKLTAWCQQHDDQTLAPAKARSYELPSLCSTESASLVRLLMEIDDPSDRVKAAIEGAVAWFESAKITGLRIEDRRGPEVEGGRDKFEVKDPSAPPLWARFYDLETGKPYVCDRDGVKKASIAEIGRERRVGYAWYTNRGTQVAEAYKKWKAKQGA